jgi:hypothetical protein
VEAYRVVRRRGSHIITDELQVRANCMFNLPVREADSELRLSHHVSECDVFPRCGVVLH